MSEAFAAAGDVFADDIWIQILIATGGVVGAMLFFVLRGIRDNQSRIWDWARDETKIIEQKIGEQQQIFEARMKDRDRWFRHEVRNLYTVIAQVAAAAGKEGQKIEADILRQMAKLDD